MLPQNLINYEFGAVVIHNDKTYIYDEWDRMSGYAIFPQVAQKFFEARDKKSDDNGVRTIYVQDLS